MAPRIGPDDLIVLSLSTHGHTDAGGRFYILPSDTGPDRGSGWSRTTLGRSISAEELSQQSETLRGAVDGFLGKVQIGRAHV